MLDKPVLAELLKHTLQDARRAGKAGILEAQPFRDQLHVFSEAPPCSRRAAIELICPPGCGMDIQVHGVEHYDGLPVGHEVILGELLGRKMDSVDDIKPVATRFPNFLAVIFPEGPTEEDCSISIRPDEWNEEAASLVRMIAGEFAVVRVETDEGRLLISKEKEVGGSTNGSDFTLRPHEPLTGQFQERLSILAELLERLIRKLMDRGKDTHEPTANGNPTLEFFLDGIRQEPGDFRATWLRRVEGLPEEFRTWRVGQGLPRRMKIVRKGNALLCKGRDQKRSGDKWAIVMSL
jgi:hypothetical protein